MKLKDWQIRALKTFVQAFGGVLVPELCLILNNGLPPDITAASKILFPVLSAALAAGISAGWNAILESQAKTETPVIFQCEKCGNVFRGLQGEYEAYKLLKENENGAEELVGTRKDMKCPNCGNNCKTVENMNGVI